MKDYLIMTAGPTPVAENTRLARSLQAKNPRFDMSFLEDYKSVTSKISSYLNTENKTHILCGEGILGLEAACASLIEEGDRCLVITNGIFGDDFADFVRIYGGVPVVFESGRLNPIDLNKLEEFLLKDHDFKLATMVHCDTPSGVLNPVEKISLLLKKYDILTVVDSVSAFPGIPVKVDNIDILLGGSQKCYSAQTGLTIATISENAFSVMEKRKSPIKSYYANLLNFKDYVFPYSMPSNDIASFKVAIDNIGDIKEFQERHKRVGELCRNKVKEIGLELHLESGFSDTVTVFNIPEGFDEMGVINEMIDKYNIIISGSFSYLKNKVLRIGHMGESAREEYVNQTVDKLKLGFNKSKIFNF